MYFNIFPKFLTKSKLCIGFYTIIAQYYAQQKDYCFIEFNIIGFSNTE
jgi:hypothetical protein